MDFIGIYEYSLFAFFSWAISSVCCILLTIQFQLVEYWKAKVDGMPFHMKSLELIKIIWFFNLWIFLSLDLTKMDGSEPIEIVITSLFMFWVFMEIFLICESGERVTAQFELFGKEFERCNWYKLSLGLQRLYMVFLSDIQKSINIRSFAGIRCTRDTLKNVNRTATLFYSFNSIHIYVDFMYFPSLSF